MTGSCYSLGFLLFVVKSADIRHDRQPAATLPDARCRRGPGDAPRPRTVAGAGRPAASTGSRGWAAACVWPCMDLAALEMKAARSWFKRSAAGRNVTECIALSHAADTTHPRGRARCPMPQACSPRPDARGEGGEKKRFAGSTPALEIFIRCAILSIAQAVAIRAACFDLFVDGVSPRTDELERVVPFAVREAPRFSRSQS